MLLDKPFNIKTQPKGPIGVELLRHQDGISALVIVVFEIGHVLFMNWTNVFPVFCGKPLRYALYGFFACSSRQKTLSLMRVCVFLFS